MANCLLLILVILLAPIALGALCLMAWIREEQEREGDK